MKRSLSYILHSGKNSKLAYYVRSYLRLLVPGWWTRSRCESLLQEIDNRADKEDIHRRINYYCRLHEDTPLPLDAQQLKDYTFPREGKVYFFDAQEIYRYFPQDYRWSILPGDITYTPALPAFVKSRPLAGDTTNAVLLKMDKVRHYIFPNDTIAWEDKKPLAIFRGKTKGKAERQLFMQMYFGSNVCDCGDVGKPDSEVPPQWHTPFMTISDHLKYRYIVALEGNDVASNLKWVMSSNSIAVMPRPTCETWFMEGTLIPDYHYIEIKPDFSDLEERLTYYNNHPDEAQAIIEHAHAYAAPFRDTHREKLIALGVMNKYFRLTQ